MYNNINLAYQPPSSPRKRNKRRSSLGRRFLKFILFAFLIYFLFSLVLSFRVAFSQQAFNTALGKLPIINQLKNIFNPAALSGHERDRINILLMGIGGAKHEGGYLTDTIMLVSYRPSTHEAVLISIPRDLYIKIPGNGWRRINYASAYGELHHYPGGGGALTAKTIEQTLGIQVDYWARIDFSGFQQLIDDLDGIDVYVDRSFSDTQYPTADFGVQTISFQRGWEHMDGRRALQFARSRHGNNGEGSDFARSKRQQKILLAVKDKILSWGLLSRPDKLYKIYRDIERHLQTNISFNNLSSLLPLVKKIDFHHLRHYVIDDSPGGLLKPITTEDGAQVLVPKSGDLNELRDFVAHIFDIQQFEQEKLKVVIVNGTAVDGLATYMSSVLSSWGLATRRLATTRRQDFEKTVIYPLKKSFNQTALAILKRRLRANVAYRLPAYLHDFVSAPPQAAKAPAADISSSADADFLIVLGYDQQRAIQYILNWRAAQAERQRKAAAAATSTASSTPADMSTSDN